MKVFNVQVTRDENVSILKKQYQVKKTIDNIPIQQRNNIIQWTISLPEDIWTHIFLNYCDFETLVTTRMLQSKYVKRCTEGNDFEKAIQGHNLHNMKWIYQCGGIDLKTTHFDAASRGNTLSIMKWLKKVDCPWDSFTFAYAARCGDLGNMEWLSKVGCPWDAWTFAGAAHCGDLNKMKWLKANKCPWDSYTFKYATSCGNIENMTWLKDNGCPWNEYTFIFAVKECNLTSMVWLKNNGCPDAAINFNYCVGGYCAWLGILYAFIKFFFFT